jgi:hypothetical protein
LAVASIVLGGGETRKRLQHPVGSCTLVDLTWTPFLPKNHIASGDVSV